MTGKLIQVVPLKKKYDPSIGDIVVGRVVSVDNGKWKVDISSYQHAHLKISAINLPGGVHRRRTDDDKGRMREFFKENDIVSCEVQSINSHDNAISLQARNLKYGKLFNGQALQVSHSLIKRMKNHYITLEGIPVQVILGNNGHVWISYSPASESRII